MVDDGTYRIRSQAGLLTDFDDLLAVLGDGGDGQLWTITNAADGTFTAQANTGSYLSLAERHGPYYNPSDTPARWTVDDEGSLVAAAGGGCLAMSLMRVFPPAAVKSTDGPTMPLRWDFLPE